MQFMESAPEENYLLGSLSSAQLNLLRSHLHNVTFGRGTVLFQTGDEVDYIYFPHSGMVSLLLTTPNGEAIETATVGREGVVGAMAGLGLYKSSVRVVVQLPIRASRVSASMFRRAVASSNEIRDLCIRYNEILLIQARINAACNALHQIEARFCRWLLQSVDRAESDSVSLTQELISEMLGVRRTSVTVAAGNLQKRGVISFSRGTVRILNRSALEQASCECYHSLIEQSVTLVPKPIASFDDDGK